MITPLMHIMSCLREDYTVGDPLNILYLNKVDREVILEEAKRLCGILLDPEVIATMDDRVFPTQYCGSSCITLSPYTVSFLEKARECARHYRTVLISGFKEDEGDDNDLSAQTTALRLEGDPKHIYYYVYNVMAKEGDYAAKIAKLAELSLLLSAHGVVEVGSSEEEAELLSRLQMQSTIGYWKQLLLGDAIRRTQQIPDEPFTKKTIEDIRDEINKLGLYGFVNPLRMYQDFSSSRISRKKTLNVPNSVLVFLSKVIQSGGG